MSINLIGSDIKIMRDRYDEALEMQGIPCTYQFPNLATTSVNGDSVVDSYSELINTHVFFDGTPKVKTFRRYGWLVDNDSDLPFLIHCSFNLPHVQKDAVFRIAGQYAEMPERVFKVTEITYDLQAPDHIVCKIIPVNDDNIVGRTSKEVANTFDKSNHFMKKQTDYRGDQYETREQHGGQ